MSKGNVRRNKVATILVIVIALGLLGYRIKDNFGNEIQVFFGNENKLVDEDSVSEGSNSGLGEGGVDTSLIEVNEEFFNGMSEKELIHYKMINSIDFFDAIEGMIKFNSMMNDGTISYTIDLKNNRSRSHSEGDNGNLDNIFNNGVYIEIDNNNKTYQDMKVLDRNKDILDSYRKLKPKQRYDKNDVILSRQTEVIVATDSIMGAEFLTGY